MSGFWQRGGGWVLAQWVLMAATMVAAPLWPDGWPGIWSRVVAGVLLVTGAVFGIGGVMALRGNRTVFPEPLPKARLVRTRDLRHCPPPTLHQRDPALVRLGAVVVQPARLGVGGAYGRIPGCQGPLGRGAAAGKVPRLPELCEAGEAAGAVGLLNGITKVAVRLNQEELLRGADRRLRERLRAAVVGSGVQLRLAEPAG
jgi:hypothetical protein